MIDTFEEVGPVLARRVDCQSRVHVDQLQFVAEKLIPIIEFSAVFRNCVSHWSIDVQTLSKLLFQNPNEEL